MYYEIFKKLCEINNVTPSKVSKATGISTATLTSWKKGVYTPKQDKLQLIADYFNVSVDYLMTGKEMEFTIEMARTDAALSNMSERIKEYALKLAELDEKKQTAIFALIDSYEKQEE